MGRAKNKLEGEDESKITSVRITIRISPYQYKRLRTYMQTFHLENETTPIVQAIGFMLDSNTFTRENNQ